MRSRKAEFCAQHAAEGMVKVAYKKCGDDGVKTQPSFGVVGSRKAEFCARHAAEGMIDVTNKNVATMVARRNRRLVLWVGGRRSFVPGMPLRA